MYDFFVNLLTPIMWGEAWIMTAWHKLFTLLGIPDDSGWGWALSIVGLTVVIRIILIPLFVRQIHSSRRMQLIQPEMQKIQAKYKGKSDPDSRQAMTQETMALYKDTGTNPFSSCLPILLQSPFFFALFQVLNHLPQISSGSYKEIGPITQSVARVIESSSLFGAQLSSRFTGAGDLNTKILTGVLIVLMSLTTFTTQRQLMRKNMPDSALDNPFMKQQKVILYLMPLFFVISGINFPIGVLLYWLTTNLWSMGQQFYVIRRLPAPGSAAEREYEDRQRRRGKTIKKVTVKGLPAVEVDAPADGDGEDDKPVSGQRQQPKGKKRAKQVPARQPGQKPAAGGAASGGAASSGASTSGGTAAGRTTSGGSARRPAAKSAAKNPAKTSMKASGGPSTTPASTTNLSKRQASPGTPQDSPGT